MKTKLEMAHDYLRDIVSNWEYDDSFDPVAEAWAYADAMQAEADKREKEKQSEHVFEAIEEWQPDWSQAPEWANFLVMSFKGTSYWHSSEPRPSGAGWVDGGHCALAHLDCYHSAGDWRNSLRKRPQ